MAFRSIPSYTQPFAGVQQNRASFSKMADQRKLEKERKRLLALQQKQQGSAQGAQRPSYGAQAAPGGESVADREQGRRGRIREAQAMAGIGAPDPTDQTTKRLQAKQQAEVTRQDQLATQEAERVNAMRMAQEEALSQRYGAEMGMMGQVGAAGLGAQAEMYGADKTAESWANTSAGNVQIAQTEADAAIRRQELQGQQALEQGDARHQDMLAAEKFKAQQVQNQLQVWEDRMLSRHPDMTKGELDYLRGLEHNKILGRVESGASTQNAANIFGTTAAPIELPDGTVVTTLPDGTTHMYNKKQVAAEEDKSIQQSRREQQAFILDRGTAVLDKRADRLSKSLASIHQLMNSALGRTNSLGEPVQDPKTIEYLQRQADGINMELVEVDRERAALEAKAEKIGNPLSSIENMPLEELRKLVE